MALHSEAVTNRLEDIMSRYDDIINLPHYEPKHKRMPLENRAPQFAPFAALTGHDAAIAETARITDRLVELSPEEQLRLSRRLNFAFENQAAVSITYFRRDPYKQGGSYLVAHGLIKKIDEIERTIILLDSQAIPLDFVTEISGDLFDSFD